MNTINIDICIATFHRNKLLVELLKSIFLQEIDASIKYRIVIVDNDKEGGAKEVVEKIKENAPVEIIYDIEPEQNIALVRNKAIFLAEGDYVVFVDDDETVAQNWLQKLIDCSKKHDALVVFGPVVGLYSGNTPKWIKKGKFFDRVRSETGSPRMHGATNNTLVDRRVFFEFEFLFNKNYGLTGGSDTELFYRVGKAGFKMVWCDEAVVSETVIAKRLSANWLIKRAFRLGQTYSRIFFPAMTTTERTVWIIRRVVFLTGSLFFLCVSWLGGVALIVKCLQKVSSNFGQLIGLTRWTYKEYKL